MVRREGKDHITYRFLCMTNLEGINRMNKHHVQYLDIPSAMQPVPHGGYLPVHEPDVIMESSSDPDSRDTTETAEFGANKPEEDDRSMPLTQAKLNNLTRNLNLSKESTQILGSRLGEKLLLHQRQHSINIETARENSENSSLMMKCLLWSTATIKLT